MEVKWLFSPWSDGSVRVSILHDLPEGVRWPIGGRLVAEGTPEDVARAPGSHTGHHLQSLLKR